MEDLDRSMRPAVTLVSAWVSQVDVAAWRDDHDVLAAAGQRVVHDGDGGDAAYRLLQRHPRLRRVGVVRADHRAGAGR
jgi:hypothetical protein